jgi:hypothetical protein
MSELAEGARLEIVCAVNSGTEGSNPSLSAIQSRLSFKFALKDTESVENPLFLTVN